MYQLRRAQVTHFRCSRTTSMSCKARPMYASCNGPAARSALPLYPSSRSEDQPHDLQHPLCSQSQSYRAWSTCACQFVQSTVFKKMPYEMKVVLSRDRNFGLSSLTQPRCPLKRGPASSLRVNRLQTDSLNSRYQHLETLTETID
jgi:hypothetical protein